MVGGHLTPRRIWGIALLAVAVFALVAGGLWWRWRASALPEARADRFLVGSPALELPSRPRGMVVLARPGAWARFLGENPSRALLLDPSWWRSLGRQRPTGGAAAGPATVGSLLLDQLRHGMVIAWWPKAWVVQAAVPGGRVARRLGALLPQRFAGRWRIENGVLRVASDARLLEGRGWKVRPAVAPSRRLACWVWWNGTGWPGQWVGNQLVFERGRSGTTPLPEPRGALLAHVRDGRELLELLESRLPSRGVLKGVGQGLDGLLSRPVGLWLRRLEPGPLPHPLLAVELDLLPHERGEKVASALHDLLCPFGCTTEEATLSDGRPAAHWQSALGSWWVFVAPGDAVVAATSSGQLETFLGARGAWPRGDWAVAGGDAAAASLSALGSARLLAVFGLLRNDQLDRMHRLAEPLRGFTSFRWVGGPSGNRIEIQPAPGR